MVFILLGNIYNALLVFYCIIFFNQNFKSINILPYINILEVSKLKSRVNKCNIMLNKKSKTRIKSGP